MKVFKVQIIHKVFKYFQKTLTNITINDLVVRLCANKSNVACLILKVEAHCNESVKIF